MDNLFKALLIIILVAFLYLYYENSDNDRYSYHTPGTAGQEVFDKKTGTLYYSWGNSENFINGTREKIEKDNK